VSFYHLELRQFPHVARRFNQSEQQVLALAKPWVGEEWIEEAERKWNMNEATLTILEGPKLSMADLAMARGWRNAQRRSEDVTERVLAAFRKDEAGAAAASGSSGGGEGASVVNGVAAAPDAALLADSLGLELLGALDDGLVAPAQVWRLAQRRLDARPLADALALAEGALRSLLGRELAVLLSRDASVGEVREALSAEQVETALGSIDTWAADEQGPVMIARKR
jgi:hypothetical protein